MDTRIPPRLTAGCLAGDRRLVAETITRGASHPSRADDPPARAADDFSPYVTKDGGISRPTDYRDTFEHLGTYAVATKPNQPLDEMHSRLCAAGGRPGVSPRRQVPRRRDAGEGSHPGRLGEAHHGAIPLGHGHQALVRDDQGHEGAIPRQRPLGRRLGLGPVPGEGARAQRGDRLHDRLQDVPRPGQEGRLGVRPRIPGAREARPGQVKRGASSRLSWPPSGPTPTGFAAEDNPVITGKNRLDKLAIRP